MRVPTGLSIREISGPPDLSRLSRAGAVVLDGKWAGGGIVIADDPIAVIEDADDPFAVLDCSVDLASQGTAVGGGWFGWFGYAALTPRVVPLPRSRLAYYPNVVRLDVATGRWFDEALLGVLDDDELEGRRSALTAAGAQAGSPSSTRGRVHTSMTQTDYESAVSACIEHIRAGDIFQANICLQLSFDYGGDPLSLYRAVSTLRPAFGAYLGCARGAVVSASPELFLRRTGRRVFSSPIKGTRARPASGAEELAEQLLASAKDRAENVMIVDMIRNDLSRVARTGSVAVPALLRLEPHPGVWHLVSDVTASLTAEVGDADLLRATFPPGSVTGAPKIRALEIIDELEKSARGVYTGAIGFISPAWGLELSVAIRTLEVCDGVARLGVGAGITAGSDPAQEWQECLDKAAALLAVTQ
jgi:aminodeoxychorismate synthase component I